MKLKIIIGFLLIGLYMPVIAQITFSEIMYDVATNENHDEFVEIFNLSFTQSIDIAGWLFSDSSGIDEIIPYKGGNKLNPRSFAVILDGSYFNNSTVYDSIVPDSVLILTIDNNAFGSSGLANTRGEYLSIINADGDTLTIYKYSIGNRPGFSDEKIFLDSLNKPENWEECQISGGTPGRVNSLSPRNIDLGFKSLSLSLPTQLFENDTVEIILRIYNLGVQSIKDSIKIEFFLDKNENYLFDNNDFFIEDKNFYYDSNNDGVSVLCKINYLPPGEHLLVANILYALDQKPENNSAFARIFVLSSKAKMCINEIKFLTFSNEPQWIELYNPESEKLLLKGWCIADRKDTVSIDTVSFLYPGQKKILSDSCITHIYDIADSLVIILNSFPKLNISEDEISLIKPGGDIQESINYQLGWLEGNEDRKISLERINPYLAANKSENWGPCIELSGATPGIRNSIFTSLDERKISLNVQPNPFSPDNDGHDDFTIISGVLPEKSARIKVQIFDIKGRLIRTLHDNYFTGSHFNVVWDGNDTSGRTARIGIYIVFVQAISDRNGVLRELKSTAVLARKL
jgi:hypothetical protein